MRHLVLVSIALLTMAGGVACYTAPSDTQPPTPTPTGFLRFNACLRESAIAFENAPVKERTYNYIRGLCEGSGEAAALEKPEAMGGCSAGEELYSILLLNEREPDGYFRDWMAFAPRREVISAMLKLGCWRYENGSLVTTTAR